ncbi:DNA-binding transcriptional LysR family regulator [Rhodobium orientis]|uniref:LysR family transcriptional regulator n=1 Tax=Rhodobium orientis TaxID=34017 RepID=A0A327JSY8_9HYPH|nr:LysR family transcriptional regulator [Rhodobium orientis]MBB4302545.1 DNA-binding transcriptional LysR family regulator [Rhodobium orientis]MBK5949394.1 LysR family transcriptional regulator [Rhodobium orientis]RAI29171.1 LysR family transcriptional regulator [Rhodobium orientis]
MDHPDLNLLVTLDALLAEGSVAGAARRLRLSPSAMSRSLARLRAATGDPLLVRAGRGLVPTPRALELKERVGPLVDSALAALRPAERLDPARLERTFSMRSREGFAETFGPALIARIGLEAPGVRLWLQPKPDKDSSLLRDGIIDLEIGVIGSDMGPELRARALFRDRFIGVVRSGHPLSSGVVTAERFAAAGHILVARRRRKTDDIDTALEPLGLARKAAIVVGGFATALSLARATDLVACVPERHTETLRAGMASFPLPVASREFTISMLWHPRLDADPAHRWFRDVVRAVCAGDPAPVTGEIGQVS